MDELLEDGHLLGHRIGPDLAAEIGADYDRLWCRIVDLVRRAGHPVIFLCPTPRASVLAVADFLEDPSHAEPAALIPLEFRTDRLSPADLARDVLAWVDGVSPA